MLLKILSFVVKQTESLFLLNHYFSDSVSTNYTFNSGQFSFFIDQ